MLGGFPHSDIAGYNGWLLPPRRFSQAPTSFIASNCQGIHRMRLVAWPYTATISIQNLLAWYKIFSRKKFLLSLVRYTATTGVVVTSPVNLIKCLKSLKSHSIALTNHQNDQLLPRFITFFVSTLLKNFLALRLENSIFFSFFPQGKYSFLITHWCLF